MHLTATQVHDSICNRFVPLTNPLRTPARQSHHHVDFEPSSRNPPYRLTDHDSALPDEPKLRTPVQAPLGEREVYVITSMMWAFIIVPVVAAGGWCVVEGLILMQRTNGWWWTVAMAFIGLSIGGLIHHSRKQ